MNKKNIILISILFCLNTFLTAQEEGEKETPKNWKFNLETGLTGSQAYYSYWASGGENSIAGRVHLLTGGNFIKERHSFVYAADLALGYQRLSTGVPQLKKTDDRLNLAANYGYKINQEGSFYYNAFVEFKSQFANGYDDKYTAITSKFAAPAYFTYGLGFEYKSKTHLSVILSPLAARHTLIMDDLIWNQKNYGFTQEMINNNQHLLTEFGANLSATFNKNFSEIISMTSNLGLFSNYLNQPQNVIVNFDLGFNFKITKVLSMGVSFSYAYDHKVNFDISDGNGGTYKAPRSQFKESLYIGIVYKM